MTNYITSWFSDEPYTDVWYPVADGSVPDFESPYVSILKGEVLEVLGVTAGNPEDQFVKFIRYNADDPPVPATLFMERSVMWGGRKAGTWFDHAVKLSNPAPFIPAEVPAYSDGWKGAYVVSVPANVYTDSACTVVLRQAGVGEVIPYDSETNGVIRSAYRKSGVWTKLYFKISNQLAVQIPDETWKEQFVLFNETSPVSWDEIPVIGEVDPPEPPEPPATDLAALTARVVKLEAADEAWKNVFLALQNLFLEMTK